MFENGKGSVFLLLSYLSSEGIPHSSVLGPSLFHDLNEWFESCSGHPERGFELIESDLSD